MEKNWISCKLLVKKLRVYLSCWKLLNLHPFWWKKISLFRWSMAQHGTVCSDEFYILISNKLLCHFSSFIVLASDNLRCLPWKWLKVTFTNKAWVRHLKSWIKKTFWIRNSNFHFSGTAYAGIPSFFFFPFICFIHYMTFNFSWKLEKKP